MNRQKLVKRIYARIKHEPCPLPHLTGPCWRWTGSHCGPNADYGEQHWEGRKQMAHRVLWKLLVDQDLPDDCDLDHLCRVCDCVYPAHCEPVSHQVNIQRGYDHRHEQRDHRCPQGHPITSESTYLNPKGTRCCRTCNRERQAAYRAANPEACRAAVRRYQAKKAGKVS